jgi:lipoprotein-releasing system permease protein
MSSYIGSNKVRPISVIRVLAVFLALATQTSEANQIRAIKLNLEYFIAKRLITTKDYKSSISTPIIKIAISAIAIGMIMMIVSVATGIGLQQKFEKSIGFQWTYHYFELR